MRFVVAIVLSLGLHGVLAVGFIAYVNDASRPDTLVALDLSSVELSLAEKVDEDAAPLQQAEALPEPRPDERRPDFERQPEVEPDPRIPPEPEAVRLPRPEEERPQLETPPPRPVVQSVAAPEQARIDVPPSLRRSLRPKYPKGARERGEQGDVVLEIRVTAEGSVDEARVVASSGFGDLDEAAVKMVRAARFIPAKAGERAVASTARITLNFRLK